MAKKRAIKSPLTKEEIMGKMKQSAEFQARIKFIKTEFWPLLCETAKSIEDAETFLSGFNTALMQAFLAQMKEKKFADLKLDEKIAGDFEMYKPLLALFNDMDAFAAKDYIEGMRNEISLFKQEEFRSRPLTSLTVKWIDEI